MKEEDRKLLREMAMEIGEIKSVLEKIDMREAVPESEIRKLKVGDTVKIKNRAWCDMYWRRGRDTSAFTPRMSRYCGKTATIMSIEDGRYEIDIDKCRWLWLDDMFETEFKAGDFVRIDWDDLYAFGILKDGFKPDKCTYLHAHMLGDGSLVVNGDIGCAYPKTCRYATSKEEVRLLKELENNHYVWNGVRLSQIDTKE